MVKNKGLDLKIAWVGGDEVSDVVQAAVKSGESFRSLTTGEYCPSSD